MADYLLMSENTDRLLGSYDSEDEALRDVARGVHYHRGDLTTARHLVLQRKRGRGQMDEIVGGGEDLARRAIARFPEPERQSA